MPARLTRWFRAQFIDSHTWRDTDNEHWWQMPGDDTRVSSPWLQMPVDLVSRATFSEWHEKVAVVRVQRYDRLRTYVTRTAMLVIVAAALVALVASWWCWLLLVPALLQVSLELYLHRYIHDTFDEPRWGAIRWMRDVADRHHRTKLLNVTGVLGVLACPLNVLAVSLAPPGGELGWLKVVALVAAIFYINSAVGNTFLDPANYTETSTMPPAMHRIRPFAPVVSLCSVVAMVAVGVANDRWIPVMVPLAYAASALTMLLGSAIRNHDRIVAAAAQVARGAVIDARIELGRVVHDDLNGAKVAVEIVRQVPGVPYRSAVELATLEAFLTHFSTRVGIDAAPALSVCDLVEKIASPYGLSPSDIRCTIDWAPDIRRENRAIAIRMATALVHNAVQALQKVENLSVPKSITVDGYTTGSGHDLRYHLAIGDHLAPVEPDRWCAEGTTLAALREWLDDTFAGELTQEIVAEGTKRVVASWWDRPPVRGYRDQGIGKEAS